MGLRAPWLARLPDQWPPLAAAVQRRVAGTLRIATVTLLAGHAGCALLLRKPALAQHYLPFAPTGPDEMMLWVGYAELGLAAVLLFVSHPAVFVGVAIWKLATESLFLLSGAPAPMFEVIERGGSYVVPLALALLLWDTHSSTQRARAEPRPGPLSERIAGG